MHLVTLTMINGPLLSRVTNAPMLECIQTHTHTQKKTAMCQTSIQIR
jgi:hypothetical protein